MFHPGMQTNDLLEPCAPDDPDAERMSWIDVPAEKLADPVISMVRSQRVGVN